MSMQINSTDIHLFNIIEFILLLLVTGKGSKLLFRALKSQVMSINLDAF